MEPDDQGVGETKPVPAEPTQSKPKKKHKFDPTGYPASRPMHKEVLFYF